MPTNNDERSLSQLNYQNLSPELKLKADCYLKLLMKIQRADNRAAGELRKRGFKGSFVDLLDNDDIYCSFCGAPTKEVDLLIAADKDIYICNKCVESCAEIIKEHQETDSK